MNAAALAILFVGLLIFFLSLPLIFRMVPMNHVYGVRIPASFESDKRWYDINAYGGRQLAVWSLLPVATGAVGLFIPPEHGLSYAWVSVLALLLAVLVPVIRVLIWSRQAQSTEPPTSKEDDPHRSPAAADRLRELDQLRVQRLVSESEYEAKRKEILRDV